jgi:tRNA (cytidine32/guanosine34-2'-O)-methyltransferase
MHFISGYDADRTYPLQSSYTSLNPLQPPITAPYKTAMKMKRNNFYNKP